MKLLIVVLNRVECLEKILEEFGNNCIHGATIIDSRGMAQSLYGHDELRFMVSLRALLDPTHKENKTIFMVLEDSQVDLVYDIVNRATGGLDNPDTGILFTLPVDRIEGIKDNK